MVGSLAGLPPGRMEQEALFVDFIQPASWDEALSAKAAVPGALPLAGGTDVMVEINFDARRPDALLDLTRIPELSGGAHDNGMIRLGAGVTYTRPNARPRGRPPRPAPGPPPPRPPRNPHRRR